LEKPDIDHSKYAEERYGGDMETDLDLRKPEKGKKKKSKSSKKLKDADGDDVANAFTGNMYTS
jgi:hypothetical protein